VPGLRRDNDAGGSGDEDVQVFADPAQITHLSELAGVKSAGASGIDVLDAGRDRQLRPTQSLYEPVRCALGQLMLDHDP
jgi:hypothetical protein